MSKPDFNEAADLLKRVGYELRDTRLPEEAFGSWYVTGMASGKFVRVVWDGRDRWLIIQQSTSGRDDAWNDLWIGRDPGFQTLACLKENLPAASSSSA